MATNTPRLNLSKPAAGDLVSAFQGTVGTSFDSIDGLAWKEASTVTATKVANYTAKPGEMVPCDTSGGGFTVTLGDGNEASGDRIGFKIVGSGNVLTVTPRSGNIDGDASILAGLTAQKSRTMEFDGTNWKTVTAFGNTVVIWTASTTLTVPKTGTYKVRAIGGGSGGGGGGSAALQRTVADAVTNSSATVTSATAAFVAGDVGAAVSGTDIPANTYVGIRNSATSIGLSSSATSNVPVNATGSHSGNTLNVAGIPNQVGGGGGGAGAPAEFVGTLTQGTVLTVTIGTGGNGSAGGAASAGSTGNAGTGGLNGVSTTITGTGISLTAAGSIVPGTSGGGTGGAANSSANTAGGVSGQANGRASGSSPVPGMGGYGAAAGATSGSSGIGIAGGGAGAGGTATAALGGGAGGAGGANTLAGTAGATGGSGTTAGVDGVAAAANSGAGGGGGGGGAPGGKGGNGGNGGSGWAIIEQVA